MIAVLLLLVGLVALQLLQREPLVRWKIPRTTPPLVHLSAAPTELGSMPERSGARTTGVGGVVQQIVFTQAGPGNLIWGDEPRFSRSTTTHTTTQAGDWSLGPAAVLVRMKNPSILGAPPTARWTVMPDSDGTAISQFCVQPVFRWSRAHGWTIAFNRVITANWQAAGRWTVPQGLGVSHVTAIGPMSVGLGVTTSDTVIHSPGTGSTQFRLVTSFLFPKAHAK